MGKIVFKFDTFEDKEEINLHMKVDAMYSSLEAIYNMVKHELKHGDMELDDHIDELLERIKDESSIVWDI